MTSPTGRLESSSGLYTRGLLDTLLKHEIAQCARYGNPLSLVMISLVGAPDDDEAIWQKATDIVVRVINANLRSSDIPGHYGRDFLIVMPYADSAGATVVARRLLETMNELFAAGALKGLGACAGLALHSGADEANPKLLVRRVQSAALQAREMVVGQIIQATG
ncbi:MAG: hypothetical protein ACE5FI_05125 [Anaerolineales bacterium]